MVIDEIEAWGVLPIACALLIFTARQLAWLVVPKATRTERLAATVVLAMILVHASVGVLGELGLITRTSLLGVLVVIALPTAWLARGKSDRLVIDAVKTAPVAIVITLVTSCLAIVSARLLPVWQWDSFGYHLPFVNLVLQDGGFAGVPADLRYISTYPHNIELGMIWLRAMIPDDRLVDLAQVPYGLAGAALTAALARQLKATTSLAALAGAAWLTVPAVFLQLPTNYVDVGTAATLLGAIFFLLIVPVTRESLVLGGLSLGLFLGSKPSAPIAVLALMIVAGVRAVKAGRLGSPAFGALAMLIFGAQQYLVMWLRHGNPVWPVAVKLGPITLPGQQRVDELLAAGAALPHAPGNVLERMSVSWLAIDSSPVFDMKLGGLGLLFLIALPLAIAGLVRRRSAFLIAAALVTLLSPDPSIPRYVLAFPAVMFAIAATQLETIRRVVIPIVVLAVAWQLHHAWPGLVGDGPPLERYAAMREIDRRLAVGPHGQPTDYPLIWERVGPGEAVAFDLDFEFPGLLWSPELRFPVYALPLHPTSQQLERFLDDQNVTVAAVGPLNGEVLTRSRQWTRLFTCKSANCGVFVRHLNVTIHAAR